MFFEVTSEKNKLRDILSGFARVRLLVKEIQDSDYLFIYSSVYLLQLEMGEKKNLSLTPALINLYSSELEQKICI